MFFLRINVGSYSEITIVNFLWNNRILCIFCPRKNQKSCIYLQQYWRNTFFFNAIEYHVCDKHFISARTETDRLWFGQEIRSDFQLFINKNVAKSRVALPGIMAAPVSGHTETSVQFTLCTSRCTAQTAQPNIASCIDPAMFLRWISQNGLKFQSTLHTIIKTKGQTSTCGTHWSLLKKITQ